MAASALPVVDVSALVAGGDATEAARAIGRACREDGFFYVQGHGVDPAAGERLEALCRAFFAWPAERKAAFAMARGGRAWRGWFPVGGELTGGAPDLKEGLYFGAELGPDDPRVRAGLPLHGPNLVPPVEGLREALSAYLEAMERLSRALMRGVAGSLGLAPAHFDDGCMREPLPLLRVFRYPPAGDGLEGQWGVGEHTDYGVLTVLRQDSAGGLQVRSRGGWVEAPPLPGTFVVNIGDMLERMTGGRYVSTPHRVRNAAARDRVSIPYFFDPGFEAEVRALPGAPPPPPGAARRWDGASVHDLSGTYGEYLMRKVGRVFPTLAGEVGLPEGPDATP